MELHKHSTQINSLLSYKDMLEKELKQTKSDENVEEQIIKLSQLQTDLSKAIDDYNESVEDGKIFNMAATLMRDDGIKSRIIRQYVPIINKFINKYLAAMDFFVNFELDENFNETIKSRFRDEFSYASFSEGEKMRINLAILFTWRAISKLRNSASTNLLIMDEVLDGAKLPLRYAGYSSCFRQSCAWPCRRRAADAVSSCSRITTVSACACARAPVSRQ
jgi:DNA repair exonuclease SbcCD ATPase subunit